MKKPLQILTLVLLIAVNGSAQNPSTSNTALDPNVIGVEASNVVTRQFSSKSMGRTMPYRVVLPAKYSDKSESGRVYPVIYLLHGLFGRFDNWTAKTKIAEYAKQYDFIIVTPEGGDGWYTDSATVSSDKYESYIVEELIPEIEKNFRTIANRDNRFIAGLSMGGYGAIKFGLKYPDKFSLVGSFSGALDAPLRGQDNKNLRPSIISVFGSEGSKTRTDNDIYRMVREASAEAIKHLPYIYFACGTEDFLFQPNREFDALLLEKKVPHEYRELPGAHTWDFWEEQVQEFLRVADNRTRTK
jgi:S-formylglutathione hydrolase FrmB